MDVSDAVATAIATVLATLITAWVTRATARASARGVAQAATTTSLAEIEKEAGKRFQETYDKLLDLRDEEAEKAQRRIAELEGNVSDLRTQNGKLLARVDAAERGLRECRALCRRLVKRDEDDSQLDPPADFMD